MWNEELTFLWNELTILWNDLTIAVDWNDLTWNDVNNLTIDYFPIPHNTLCLPPKFCITYCLKMLLGKCNTPRSI